MAEPRVFAKLDQRYTQTVTITPGEGQPEDSIERDVAAAFAAGDEMRERGTEHHRTWFRRWGRLRVMASKDVGPPPWPWPRVLLNCTPRNSPTLRLGAGWRMTAVSLYVMWHAPSLRPSKEDET